MPAQGHETYEIIRRHLFQELDAEGIRARERPSSMIVQRRSLQDEIERSRL
jgi:hypothetical protein